MRSVRRKRANDDHDHDKDLIGFAAVCRRKCNLRAGASWPAMQTYGQGFGLYRRQWLM
jgi:hypothetical protein